MTSPVIRCLKTQRDDVIVHYLTKPNFADVLSSNPYIDKLHLLKSSLKATIEELRTEGFDLIIDLHHNLRTLIIKKRLGSKSFSFKKLNLEKWLLVNARINIMPEVHIVDRYLETVRHLGVHNDGLGLDYFLGTEYDINELLPASHLKYVALVIGAQHATKRLPQQKIIELCTKIKKPIVLLGGKEDKYRGEEIARLAGSHVLNTCGNFKLNESAFIVKMAEKVISHDTGLMHIAAAFKKQVLSVWGSTVPEFGMYPYQVGDSPIFEVKGLPCRPCSKIGYETCPRGHFKCMNKQDLTHLSNVANA